MTNTDTSINEIKRKNFILIIIGIVAGMASGALGIGGGVIIVPALTILLEYSPNAAIQLSLAAIVPIAAVGAISHAVLAPQNSNTFLFAGLLVLGALPGSITGLLVKRKIRTNVLYFLFAVLFFYTALKISHFLPEFKITFWSGPAAHTGLTQYQSLVVTGFLAGLISSLFGIGGGVIIVPILDQIFGLTLLQAIGISLTVIVPITLFGSWIHRKQGLLHKEDFYALLPGALIGAVLGGYAATLAPSMFLRYLFSLVLFFSSYKMVRKGMLQ